jgi:hypothetical protein
MRINIEKLLSRRTQFCSTPIVFTLIYPLSNLINSSGLEMDVSIPLKIQNIFSPIVIELFKRKTMQYPRDFKNGISPKVEIHSSTSTIPPETQEISGKIATFGKFHFITSI